MLRLHRWSRKQLRRSVDLKNPFISIIVPVYNEENYISTFFESFPEWSRNNIQFELIFVDGNSSDNTIDIIQKYPVKVITAHRGRGSQMNAGASIATGNILFFLHIDSILPPHWLTLISTPFIESLNEFWGFFHTKLSGTKTAFRIIEKMMNWRSCITGIATGDKGIFISKNLFSKIGGFPDISLMEDIEISIKLKKNAQWHCIKKPIITSSRKWEQYGILKTVLQMWLIRLMYFFGVSPQKLVKIYYPKTKA